MQEKRGLPAASFYRKMLTDSPVYDKVKIYTVVRFIAYRTYLKLYRVCFVTDHYS